LNKLAKFTGPNTLECVDAKGKTQTITGARFIIAVGGRPTALDCPGAQLAISSDDLFSLENAPGKTCVVGAGYVALECAGFVNGLHQVRKFVFAFVCSCVCACNTCVHDAVGIIDYETIR
jgi:thioredoxin reductase (NADPH)